MSAGSAEHGAVALRFAHALTTGTFDLAHSLLTPILARELSVDERKASYEHMIEYGEGPAKDVQLITTLEQWPDKAPGESWMGLRCNHRYKLFRSRHGGRYRSKAHPSHRVGASVGHGHCAFAA